MQEYCKSDKGRRRRLDRANAAKKQKQQGQWDQPKGWQNHPPKQANRQINNVSAPPDQSQNRNSGGHKGGYKNGKGSRPQQQNPPQRGGGERFFCWLHGIDAHHHTHQCPSAVKMKLEWEAEEKAKAAGMTVNHVMKYQNAGQFRALPPPYHHQSFQPSAPTHVFHSPQSYTPSAPQLPPPPPMHAQQASVFVPSWPNPAAHHQTHYAQPPPPPPPKQEAPDSSSSGMMGMVNIINAISSRSNEPVHETKRQRQKYYRSVSHICSGKYFQLPWSHIPITFTAADIRLQHYPHNDPLIIRANIGKNTKHYLGNDVGRVLVDNGSSADILTWQCFSGMGFKKEDLKKAEHLLYGFGNKRIKALGKIDFNVTFGQDATMRTEVITFDVVDFVYLYNAIFGRNTINKFAAVIHQGYLLMKIPTTAGVISVYGSQEEARRAERNTSMHNRQVHVIN
jgi:hypothetical protein